MGPAEDGCLPALGSAEECVLSTTNSQRDLSASGPTSSMGKSHVTSPSRSNMSGLSLLTPSRSNESSLSLWTPSRSNRNRSLKDILELEVEDISC